MNFRKTRIICIGKRLVVGKYLVEDCLVPGASENSRALAVVVSCFAPCSQSFPLFFKLFDIRRGKYTDTGENPDSVR